MFETYLGEKFFALLFLFPNVAVFFVQKKLIISIGRIVFGIQVFWLVQFFFLILWLLSSRFQTDNKKLKFQTNLQIEFFSIVDICPTFARLSSCFPTCLFSSLWVRQIFFQWNFFSKLRAVVKRYRYFLWFFEYESSLYCIVRSFCSFGGRFFSSTMHATWISTTRLAEELLLFLKLSWKSGVCGVWSRPIFS